MPQLDLVTGKKVCARCKREKVPDDYGKQSHQGDGLHPWCRECSSEHRNLIRRTNPDRERTGWVNWRAINRDRIMLRNAHDRAKKKALPFGITREDIYIPDSCPLCGCLLACRSDGKRTSAPSSPSLDMYNPKLGYVPGNIWVICMLCNARKQSMSGEDHIAFGLQLIDAFEKACKQAKGEI